MKLHWYAFAFQHQENNVKVIATCILGLPEKRVNIKNIQRAREVAVIDANAVMLSCCYLGEMTSEEFQEE